jgi:hypothetical protein
MITFLLSIQPVLAATLAVLITLSIPSILNLLSQDLPPLANKFICLMGSVATTFVLLFLGVGAWDLSQSLTFSALLLLMLSPLPILSTLPRILSHRP